MTQKELKEGAIIFAKKHKTTIAKKLADTSIIPASDMPVSIFMAGSPGAGKTEFSKNLLDVFEKKRPKVLRIDGDELRDLFPDYTGNNSKFFQGGVSILVEKLHDIALQQKQNFILDGTFWRTDKALENINRSLKKNRIVFIFYLYQAPKLAWNFTRKREVLEGRNIPKYAFIEQFIGARKTVKTIRSKYGDEVAIYLVQKNYQKNTEKLTEIEPGQDIDQYMPTLYTKSALKKLL